MAFHHSQAVNNLLASASLLELQRKQVLAVVPEKIGIPKTQITEKVLVAKGNISVTQLIWMMNRSLTL